MEGRGRGVDGQLLGYLAVGAQQEQAAGEGDSSGGTQASESFLDHLPRILCSFALFVLFDRVNRIFHANASSRLAFRAAADGLVTCFPGCSIEPSTPLCYPLRRRPDDAAPDGPLSGDSAPTNYPTRLSRSRSLSSTSVHDQARLLEGGEVRSVRSMTVVYFAMPQTYFRTSIFRLFSFRCSGEDG